MAHWTRTQIIKRNLEDKISEDKFCGRRIICRDSPIDGGVYIGNGREAIVVDSAKYPALKTLYEKAKQKATIEGRVCKHLILYAVYDTVKNAMRYDKEAVDEIIDNYKVRGNKKIALDVFIKKGVGVCRHQALACGTLLELFKKEGYISGKPSIDRNRDKNKSHAWCRYTNSKGEVFILDVANEYIGPLKTAGKYRWSYERPEDY